MSKSSPESTQQGWEEISDLERRLIKIVDEMSAMSGDVAAARQIRDFASDCRKSVLADAIEAVLSNKPDLSVSGAEHAARSLPSYKEAMKRLVSDSLKAETSIATWEVLNARLDCTRSILSTRRELSKL